MVEVTVTGMMMLKHILVEEEVETPNKMRTTKVRRSKQMITNVVQVDCSEVNDGD